MLHYESPLIDKLEDAASEAYGRWLMWQSAMRELQIRIYALSKEVK